MMRIGCWIFIAFFVQSATAQHQHNMQLNAQGMVMNANAEHLPDDCASISEDKYFTVYAGVEYSKAFVEKTFGYSEYIFRVKACSRVHVTFINRDAVRHQWMLHGLPRYLYDKGMFHLEAAGGEQVDGVFIVPSDHKTYLIHCDVSQHMQKGMKAQLVVGKGSGNLWSVPGVSDDLFSARNLPAGKFGLLVLSALSALIAFVVGVKKRSK